MKKYFDDLYDTPYIFKITIIFTIRDADIKSGLKFNRKGFIELLNMIEDNKINNIYITHRDRLARFGFDLIESICKIHNTKITIYNVYINSLSPAGSQYSR